MKKVLIGVLVLFAVPAFAGPIKKSQCQLTSNGTYRVELQLAKGFDFGKLILKNHDKDYSQDLTQFKQDKLTVELLARNGVRGYALDYRLSGLGEYVTYSGDINCDEHKSHKKNQSEEESELAAAAFESDHNSIQAFNSLNDLDREEIYDVDDQVALDY